MKPQLEICCYSVASVRAAAAGGADRVELCASRPEGGVTPSYAAIELARQVPEIGLYVIVRPRGGDFCYSAEEFNCMKRDIVMAGKLGADGVVIGMLRPDGSVDKDRLRELVDAAGEMDITFHRAFDMSSDPEKALEDIRQLGICRVLSSGTRNTVDEGLPVLAELVRRTALIRQTAPGQAGSSGHADGSGHAGPPGHAGGPGHANLPEQINSQKCAATAPRAGQHIEIMAGSGVQAGNLEALYRVGIRQFHSSAAKSVASAMRFRNPHIQMGKAGGVDEYAILEADEQLVSQMRRQLEQLHSGNG